MALASGESWIWLLPTQIPASETGAFCVLLSFILQPPLRVLCQEIGRRPICVCSVIFACLARLVRSDTITITIKVSAYTCLASREPSTSTTTITPSGMHIYTCASWARERERNLKRRSCFRTAKWCENGPDRLDSAGTWEAATSFSGGAQMLLSVCFVIIRVLLCSFSKSLIFA